MWKRFRKWLNVDHAVDVTVDLFLILFDVLSSPILIFLRMLRWTVGTFLLDGIKSRIKKLIYWLRDKPRWVQLLVTPAFVIIVAYILIFIWIFGEAWGEFVHEEFGDNNDEL
jgi:hypothetical protein